MNAIESVIREVAKTYRDDVTQAIEIARQRLKALPEFSGFVDTLVDQAIQELVYRERCRSNQEMRRDGFAYDGAAKVVAAASTGANEVYRSWFDYYIGSKTLGGLLGEELRPLAGSERELANGHTFNAMLLDRLHPLVPKDKKVREVVPEKKLNTIVRNIRKAFEGGKAA